MRRPSASGPERSVLQVSAGTGPVEVRRFVGALVPVLGDELRRRGCAVDTVSLHGPEAHPRSASLVLPDFDEAVISDLIGTHLLVSADRGRRARRRWYAAVAVQPVPPAAPALELGEVEVRACRAGGPGGQHVNTASTAVRVVHRPTGLQVRAAVRRSRSQNLKTALARLAELVAQESLTDQARARRASWLAHHQVVRGRPVCTWRRGRDGLLVRKAP